MAQAPRTEAMLREMIRAPRYWQPRRPGHRDWVAEVTEGYRALYAPKDGAEGTVPVRAYDRRRNGQMEHVAAHTGSGPEDGAGRGDARPDLLLMSDGGGPVPGAAPGVVPGVVPGAAPDGAGTSPPEPEPERAERERADRIREEARSLAEGLGIDPKLIEGQEAAALPGLSLLARYPSLSQHERNRVLHALNQQFGQQNPELMEAIRQSAATSLVLPDWNPATLGNAALIDKYISNGNVIGAIGFAGAKSFSDALRESWETRRLPSAHTIFSTGLMTLLNMIRDHYGSEIERRLRDGRMTYREIAAQGGRFGQ